MAIFLSAAINNFHIFMAIYGYGHYGVPIPAKEASLVRAPKRRAGTLKVRTRPTSL